MESPMTLFISRPLVILIIFKDFFFSDIEDLMIGRVWEIMAFDVLYVGGGLLFVIH